MPDGNTYAPNAEFTLQQRLVALGASMTSPMRTPTPRDWARHLSQWAWSHTADLTTAEPCSKHKLLRRFHNEFIRGLAQTAQASVPFFCVIEHSVQGFPHLHVLLGETEGLTISQVQRRWRAGYSRVRIFNPRNRALFYAVKQCDELNWDYELSTKTPRRRSGPAEPGMEDR